MAALTKTFVLPPHEESVRRSKLGYAYNVVDDVWAIGPDHKINFKLLSEQIDRDVLSGLRLTLARMAEEVSPAHVNSCFFRMKQVFLHTEHYTGGVITETQILNARSSVPEDREWEIGVVRALLRFWIEWEYPGVQNSLTVLLDKLHLKGNVQGRAVRIQCPYSGPWTITEQQSLVTWAGNAYLDETLSLMEYAWFLLCFQTARRPIQLRSLRVCDLKVDDSREAHRYFINIPRAKQRGAGGGFRKQFRELQVSEDLFLTLLNLGESVQKTAIKSIPNLQSEDLQQLPLLLPPRAFLHVGSRTEFRQARKNRPDSFHITAAYSSQLSRQISRKCDAFSERTNDTIHFSPVRCRRTRATNLVRHGIRGVELAYLLDHSNTGNIGIYTAFSPELALRIFSKMDEAMSFLAARLEGRVIASEFEAKRRTDPSSRRFTADMKYAGSCAGNGCVAGVRSCVSCVRFQPLVDAPWDELLLELTEELEERRAEGASHLVLQSYDIALAHVAALIKVCEQKRNAGEVLSV